MVSPVVHLDTLLIGNHLVDQYGVDNLEIGSIISWAMELYENGILTSKDTDGIDLRFGNDDAVIAMVHHICKRDTKLGDILAEGGIKASEKIGKDSFKYLIHMKGMQNLHSNEESNTSLAANLALASGFRPPEKPSGNRPLPSACACHEGYLQQPGSL